MDARVIVRATPRERRPTSFDEGSAGWALWRKDRRAGESDSRVEVSDQQSPIRSVI